MHENEDFKTYYTLRKNRQKETHFQLNYIFYFDNKCVGLPQKFEV